jgi:hypothetical protein
MDTQIDAIYEPKDGQPDDWKGGLLLNGDRLGEYSGIRISHLGIHSGISG